MLKFRIDRYINIYTHVPITSNLTLAWWVIFASVCHLLSKLGYQECDEASFTNNHIVRPIVRKQTGLLQSTGNEFC